MGRRVYNRDGTWRVERKRASGEGSWRRLPNGNWQLRLMRHGVLITASGKSKALARNRLAERIRRLEQGLPARTPKVSLGAWVTQWEQVGLEARVFHGQPLKPTTKAMYKTLATRHITGADNPSCPVEPDPISEIPIGRLVASDVERWLLRLRQKGLADSTIRSAYNVLRLALDAAVNDRLIPENPAAKVGRPLTPPTEARHLSIDELRRLLDAADGHRYQEILWLITVTAMRRGECLALKWHDVDLVGGTITVRGTLARVGGRLTVLQPKTHRSGRTIEIPPFLVDMLARLKDRQDDERQHAGNLWVETGFVFTTQFGRPVDPRDLFRTLQGAARRAGLEGVGLHTLRHSCATALVNQGENIKNVSTLLGHSSTAITANIYLHGSTDGRRSAVANMVSMLRA